MKHRSFALAAVAGIAALLVAVPAALALDIADGDPPSGTVGVPYSYTFKLSEKSGTKATWDISSGALPPGLTLSGSDRSATLSGTPTQSGSFSFYLRATDIPGPWVCCTEVKYAIAIAPGLTIVTGPLPAGSVGVPYGVQLSTSGGAATSWTITAGALPAGLTLGQNGTITGTPTQAALSTFTVRASDGSRTATKPLTLAIVAPVVVTGPEDTTIRLGRSFVMAFTATGGLAPYRWSAASLPAGVNVDPATGRVGGRPQAAGDVELSLTATDALGTAQSATATVHVASKLSLTTTTLGNARNGKRYRAVLRAQGGGEPLAMRLVGALPSGLRFDEDQGVLEGRPKLPARKPRVTIKRVHTAKGIRRVRVVKHLKPLARRYTLYLVVHDALGQRDSQKLRLTVTP